MPARTKEARLRRTLTVKDVNGHPVTFHLKRDWATPQSRGWGPTPRRQQVTVVTVGPQEDTKHPVYALVHYLWLLQSEQARAYIPQTPTDLSNIPMAVGKVRQDGTVEHPRWSVLLTPFPTFDGETARSVEAFINEFHLKHITGAVQQDRVQQAISKLGPARELKRIPIWEVNAAFPEPTATDGTFDRGEFIAVVYDFPQSGRDELHFVWGSPAERPQGSLQQNEAGRAVVQRSELVQTDENGLTVWAGRAEDEDGVEDLEATDFIRIKRIAGERVWSEANNDWTWPGMYVREEDVSSLRLATVYQPMGFPMLGTVGLGDNATTEVSAQAIIEYMGKSKGEGAKLRFTVNHNRKQYVFNTTQKHLMTSRGDGVRVTDGTTGWSAAHITVPHSLVSHILVALDKRIEEGLAGSPSAESILQPWRAKVFNSHFMDDDIDVDLAPVGRVRVNIIHIKDGKVTQSDEYKTLSRSEVLEMLQRPRVEGSPFPAVLEYPTSTWAFSVSDLERALVVFDRLEEMGTPLDGLGASRPANRTFVTDVHGRKWQAKMQGPSGRGWGPAVVYRPMIGRNYDGGARALHGPQFSMQPIQLTVPAGGATITGFVVAPERDHRSLQREVDIEAIPLLSEAEATRLLTAVNAYLDYFATGQNQRDYREGRASKLGRAAQVATLPVWRNPVEGIASTRDSGDERLAVYVYPESGTDTVGLETDLQASQKDRVSQAALRPTLFTHASVLGARYASPSYNSSPERVRSAPGSEDFILVYPFGMETYNAGVGGMKRVGLYARVSDVYNALYAGWREHQKGWGQRDAGLRTMPNFPFEVELQWGDSNVPASARIEYMGKSKAGIPQFEVTADATRGATSSMWAKRVKGQVVPRTFYTDAKLLQHTPNLFENKELLKWQHTHNPYFRPEMMQTGTRLSPESHQQVLVALDARYEAGLKGAEWKEGKRDTTPYTLSMDIKDVVVETKTPEHDGWVQRNIRLTNPKLVISVWTFAGLPGEDNRYKLSITTDGSYNWQHAGYEDREQVIRMLTNGRFAVMHNAGWSRDYVTGTIVDRKTARETFEVWRDKLLETGVLQGLADTSTGSAPHTFPLFERDDTGYPSRTADAYAKVGMGRDGHPYVWVYAVREYHHDGKQLVARELEKPRRVLTQSIFAFTDSRELYYGFKANRDDGDREEVNWHINRGDIDAIRAEVCRKLKSGEVKLDDWTRGFDAWCRRVASPLDGVKRSMFEAANDYSYGVERGILKDAGVEMVDDGGMCEGE